jgi:hypothetical protein
MSNLPMSIAELEARHPTWSIAVRRDGLNLVSAEKKPTEHSLIYVVATSVRELSDRLDEIDAAEQVPERDRLDDLADNFQPPEEGQ